MRHETSPGRSALFVYGTLREEVGGPAGPRRALERSATPVSEGVISARLFDAGGFPAAVPDSSSRVRGEVYEMDDPEPLLGVLDRYEGCRPDGSGLFRREVVTVRLDSGGELRAWVYFFNSGTDGYPEIPSGDYREYLSG